MGVERLMPTLKKHSEFVIAAKAAHVILKMDLDETDRCLGLTKTILEQTEKGRDIVNEVIQLTHGKEKKFIQSIVTQALSAVYGDEYGFELEFVIKRNQPEAIPWIIREGERYSPRDEVGGGVLDIASLAMRLAVWSLTEPRPAPLLVLDEPAKFLSRDKQAAFGEMLREISRSLGIQVLIVSHSTDIIEQADKAYEVWQEDGISKVKEIE